MNEVTLLCLVRKRVKHVFQCGEVSPYFTHPKASTINQNVRFYDPAQPGQSAH